MLTVISMFLPCAQWVFGPLSPVSLYLSVEESKLTDRRILVLFQMVIASRSIPSRPAPSSVSVAMQTVMRTYADASVEAVNVHCMPQGEFCQLMWEMVQENALTQIYALLREMQSSVEAAAAGTELLLNMELVQVQRVQAAFIPIAVEGDLTPESDKGGHLIELSKDEAEEGIDGEETSL